MVKPRMYRRIRRLKKQGWSKSRVARELGLDRGTVAKYFEMSDSDFREGQNAARNRRKLLDAYRQDILDVYTANGNRKLNMASVFDYLEEKHGPLECTEKSLRNYVRFLVEQGALAFSEKARLYRKVPELPFGKQLQVDFGQYRTPSGLKLYIFACVLSASRFRYAAFQEHPFCTRDVIHHLLSAFEYCGGMPRELVIDQDAVLVVSENRGDIVYTREFKSFIDEMNLDMYVCRKADPESKGKIENFIKFLKGNFLGSRDFSVIQDAEPALSEWLNRRANGKPSAATGHIPAELIEEERKHLRPLRESIFRKDALAYREGRRVDDKSFISFQGSQYSVPTRYRGREVEVFATQTRLVVFDVGSGAEITEHGLSALPGAKIAQKWHFRDTEKRSSDMQAAVRDMFDLDSWRSFCDRNQKRFQRYVRDQCVDARKYFSGDIAVEHLERSLRLCLENSTLTFADLRDTYQFFVREEEPHAQGTEVVQPVPSGNIPVLEVSRRKLSEYESLRSADRRVS